MLSLDKLTKAIDSYRDRVVASTTSLFSHAPDPLGQTLTFAGDPGMCGPDSMTWPVVGDVAAFIGGIRALLVQAAHPEVAAGVAGHSSYRQDPLGRLSRTSAYVTATSFGAMEEVHRVVEMVRKAHRPVRGVSHRDRPYSAAAPTLTAWVHNALTDSFLVAYQVYGPARLTPAKADLFVREQASIGRLLGAKPIPESAAELATWIAAHPNLGSSPGLTESIGFLRRPPLPTWIRIPYRVLMAAAVATLPIRVRRILGVRRMPGAVVAGRLATAALRWALGSSPAWHRALVRAKAPVPDGLFRQPLRVGENIDLPTIS